MHEPKVLSLSTISHELRNPLTLIHSTLQLIGRHYPEVTNDPLWPQLLSDINYMSQLLSELSSLNSSQTLHYSQIDIRQFLTNIVSTFQSTVQLQTKEIRLNFETDEKILVGDSVKIREVFINLIKNALEATGEGDQIWIEVKSRWNRLVVTVSDSGSGMDACRLSTIFEPFITYKPDGTGLGLTIVKNIINTHGGAVQVYSKPGIGTKFIVILPLLPPEKASSLPD